jgi:hypothetical protein
MFDVIRNNYKRGLWTKQMVAIAVRKGVITPAQYEEITGEDFAE